MEWHLIFMAGLYILAGILHFLFPRMYQRIMPDWIPEKKIMVYLTGVLEVVLGVALFFPAFRNPALYGIILLLISFLPVHTNMLRNEKAQMNIPLWILWLRIPFQGLLIYWAFLYL